MMDLLDLLSVFAFALGAVIASFLNVVIWRVPRGESIVRPASHCPKCGAEIRWYQNVPIFSWLALCGKCAKCKSPISPRYILIETLGGVLFLAAFLKYAPSLTLLVMWVWIALMIVGSFIDFDHQLLPDFVTIGGMVLGVAFHVFNSLAQQTFFPLLSSLLGLVFGFGLLALVRHLGTQVFKREAMGMGDVLLMGAVGALFGPVAVLVVLILSSLFGSAVGLTAVAFGKTKLGKFAEIPYGPYICLAALVWMFFGAEIVSWYLGLMKV